MIHRIKIKDREFYIQAYIPNEYANLSAIPVKDYDKQLECIKVGFRTKELTHTGKDSRYVEEFMKNISPIEIIQSITNKMDKL